MDWRTIVAGYAAGVSTVVGAQQVVRELPSVKIRAVRGATIHWPGAPPESILIVDVINAGRRPVTIEQVAYISPEAYLSIPSIWVEGVFTLHEGDRRSLRHPENGTIPEGALFAVRDTLGRWWPRRRGLRIRLRRRWWNLRHGPLAPKAGGS